MNRSGPTSSFFPLTGGLDLSTPAIATPPGRVVAALNYEPVASGYRRLSGYERFNGETAPSDAVIYQVDYDDNALGGNVTQFTTGEVVRNSLGATIGVAVADATLVSGSWGTATAVGRVKIRTNSGNPALLGDNVRLDIPGPITRGYQKGAASLLSASASATLQRALIEAVPGSGPIRGVWYYGGNVLVVRNNVGATEGVFYQSSSGGWAAVSVARRLNFTSGGTTEIMSDGSAAALIEGATSAASANVQAVILQSGSWAGGDAAGYLLVASQSGTFQAENLNLNSGALNVATIAGNSTAVTLPPGGRYKFINHNFYGAADRECMYGANGVGYAFEYDGTTINVAIVTGTAADTPHSIAAHRNSLFLAYEGGSVQFSQVAEPLLYDAALGAGEIGIGDEVVDFIPANQDTLAILGATSISVLTGNDSTDYVLSTLNAEAGAIQHTAQRIGNVIYLDNRGLRTLSASASTGGFRGGTLTILVDRLLEDFRKDNVQPVASIVCRTADQYWLFFDNDTALVVYMIGKEPAILPVNLGFTVSCGCSVEIEGEERIFLGADDGFVYELNKGTSFDGAVIEHYVRLPFNHFGGPQQLKRFHKAVLELEASGTTTISVSADLDFGAVDGLAAQTLSLTTGGGAIDSLGSNESYYASQIETTGEVYLEAVAKNISLKIAGSTSTEEPHTLTGVTFLISPRGMQR